MSKAVKFKIIEVFNSEKLGFRGNTSAVVELPNELAETKLQEIAQDFQQPATTFIWKSRGEWYVRWFAVDAEIALCGHGSAAAAAYLGERGCKQITLHAPTLKVNVESEADRSFSIETDVIEHSTASPPLGLEEALGEKVLEYYHTSNKDIAVLKDENAVKNCQPLFESLARFEPFGYAITASASDGDFVSRTLVPKVKQLEDFATGSSHAALAPFWAKRLNKNELKARQLSTRGGYFECFVKPESNMVQLRGSYKVLAEGQLYD